MGEKTVLITGASNGIGFLTAVKCAEKGFRVIATMRNIDKAQKLDVQIKDKAARDRIIIRQLDVTDETSIASFKTWLSKGERVDILINNAGMAVGGFVEELPLDAYRQQLETNFFGLVAVTQAVLPLMRRQGAGKILNISSVSGVIGFPGLSPYAASKHAVEGFTESLRLEVVPFGIDVALIEPGSFQTDIWTTGTTIPEQAARNNSPYKRYMERMKEKMAASRPNYEDPVHIADQLVRFSDKEKLSALRYPVGKGVRTMLLFKKLVPWKLWERMVHKQLKISSMKEE
ncbi:SDR family oxidoreductase [Thalassobacillus pellis]|uniref:SDR family oxidoreductase n=1 Tax=Thalassobacillus pellis TaxID=748008 RepID=UPI00195FA2C5|nr:SDR family oxidoreductase [Thalassobacillus pellis]MBM7553032.1 NAD(P)-dependent dehydrogenase (short-subunit alcohol dehydrogenase family) [Thalassobacillus pellis]